VHGSTTRGVPQQGPGEPPSTSPTPPEIANPAPCNGNYRTPTANGTAPRKPGVKAHHPEREQQRGGGTKPGSASQTRMATPFATNNIELGRYAQQLACPSFD
jgi:hypothetical protein